MHRSFDHWPEATRLLDDDITIGDLSLRRCVEANGTPLVIGSESGDLAETPLLITQVQAIDRHYSGRMVVQLDCRLDRLPFVWSEARLVSRPPKGRSILWLAVRKPSRTDIVYSDDVVAIPLPADLRLGDLIAIPGRSVAAANAVRAELS